MVLVKGLGMAHLPGMKPVFCAFLKFGPGRKKRGQQAPFLSLFGLDQAADLRRERAKPSRPSPSNASVPGSATVAPPAVAVETIVIA